MSKKKSDDELGTEMERLAVKLAKGLVNGDTVSKATSDTFGKLTSYFAATRKLNLKTPDPEDEGETFSGFRDKIASTKSPAN